MIYTAASRMAYASLWDQADGERNHGVSVAHYRKHLRDSLQSFISLFPDVKPDFVSGDYSEDSLGEIAAEVYRLMLTTGGFYHESHWIRPAVLESAIENGVLFVRGTDLGKKYSYSGVGAYIVGGPDAPKSDSAVARMFGLNEHPLAEVWEHLLDGAVWNPMPDRAGVQFLSHGPERRFWTNEPIREGFSLLRVYTPGRSMYYMYEAEQSDPKAVSPLPTWLVSDTLNGSRIHNYAANACLAANGVLAPVRYLIAGDLVRLRISRPLAPAEQNWLGLYSWPELMTNPEGGLKRICQTAVFKAVRSILEHQGYRFEEEAYGNGD